MFCFDIGVKECSYSTSGDLFWQVGLAHIDEFVLLTQVGVASVLLAIP